MTAHPPRPLILSGLCIYAEVYALHVYTSLIFTHILAPTRVYLLTSESFFRKKLLIITNLLKDPGFCFSKQRIPRICPLPPAPAPWLILSPSVTNFTVGTGLCQDRLSDRDPGLCRTWEEGVPSVEGIIQGASKQLCLVFGKQCKAFLGVLWSSRQLLAAAGLAFSQVKVLDGSLVPYNLSSCGSVKACPSVLKLGFIQRLPEGFKSAASCVVSSFTCPFCLSFAVPTKYPLLPLPSLGFPLFLAGEGKPIRDCVDCLLHQAQGWRRRQCRHDVPGHPDLHVCPRPHLLSALLFTLCLCSGVCVCVCGVV